MNLSTSRPLLFYYPLWIFVFAIVSLRIFLTDHGFFNLPFLILAGLSPLVMFKYYVKRIYYSDLLLLCMWCIMLSFSILHHHSFKVVTIFYTLFFILSYTSFMQGVRNHVISLSTYKTTIKWLLYAYWVVLVIQEVCVLADLPIFNLINTNVTGFKLNSLAIEPSQTARYVFMLMITYLHAWEVERQRKYALSDAKQDKLVWIAFFYLMLFMGSVSALIFIPFLFLRFISVKNFLFIASTILLILIAASFFTEYETVNRALSSLNSVFSFDEYEIMKTDGSGSTRIAPIIIYLKNMDFGDPNFWFGYGMDGHIQMFTSVMSRVFSSLPKNFPVGGLVATFINYGFIVTLIFMGFLFKICVTKGKSIDFVLIFLLAIVPSGLNTLIAWAAIMMLAANKYFAINNTNNNS